MKLLFASAAALVVSASVASAAVVDFQLAGAYETNQSAFVYESDGLELTVSGLSCGTYGCSAEDIDRSSAGIGMDTGWLDGGQVDNSGRDEYLQLSFSEEVELVSATFTYVTAGDDFVLYNWDGYSWTYGGYGDICTYGCGWDNSEPFTYDFASAPTGDSFLLGASDPSSYLDYGDWNLYAVSVDLNAVPLPAAAWMLLAGLGGLALMRRPDQQATA